MTNRRDSRRLKRLALSLGVAALALVVVAPAVGAADAKTKRVSIKSGGGQVNGQSDDASISANGRYIAFSSGASDLVGNDTNSTTDIFVHDRVTKKTRRVSRRTNGAQGNGPSHSPSISASGRYVAFVSSASNLVGNDTNGHVDIFVHDRKTKKTRLVSKRTNGAQANDHSSAPSISANGRVVAFRSDASNLVGADSNGKADIFVRDRDSKRTRRVNVKSSGGQAIGEHTFHAFISANGRYVAFSSAASNLVANDLNGKNDVFVHDRRTRKTRLVSKRTDGTRGDSGSFEPSLSATGRFVAFTSSASNLVGNDTNGAEDVFVHDRETKKTKLISKRTNGAQGDDSSYEPSISASGRYVAFASDASTLVGNDTNGSSDVFVHDRWQKKTRRVSVKNGGGQGSDHSEAPALSADGRFVAFESEAKLVTFDTNDGWDIYLRGPVR